MSDIAKIVGERLRRRRLELGYSQEQTSEKAGFHPTYIGQLERGEKNATIESVEKICIALDYPMEELFAKIIVVQDGESVAAQCFDEIVKLPVQEQEKILQIIEKIIGFRK